MRLYLTGNTISRKVQTICNNIIYFEEFERNFSKKIDNVERNRDIIHPLNVKLYFR